MKFRFVVLVGALALVVAACGGSPGADTSTPTTIAATTEPPTTQADHETTTSTPTTIAATTEPPTTQADHETTTRGLEAAQASITVDGDPSDWEGIEALEVMLDPIEGKTAAPHQATVQVAYDDAVVYFLMTVEDDYDWNPEDAKLSAAAAAMWAIDAEAGPHMGTEAEDGEGPSLGVVDIWHWELECGPGEEQGGRINDAGDGNDPGNDSGCNFDDEWATDPETREDDNGEGAENSLLGVFTHSAQTEGADGTWYFEMSRPWQSGDAQDAQFAVGTDMLLTIAYWDPDESPEGWEDADHVQSSNEGWITVAFG